MTLKDDRSAGVGNESSNGTGALEEQLIDSAIAAAQLTIDGLRFSYPRTVDSTNPAKVRMFFVY